MGNPANNSGVVRTQYADSSNLNARARLHARFSTNTVAWPVWVFDQLDLPARCRILEVGCGTGSLWAANRGRVPSGWDITLSDASPGMTEEAREKTRGAGARRSHLVADAQRLPFDNASFHAVIANHMLYHVPDLLGGLAEIRRVLTPGGRLYATTNGRDHMRELRQIAADVAPGLPFARNAVTDAFSLEDGPGILSQAFEHVTVRRFEGGLEVTESEPLVEYILSCVGAGGQLTGEQASRLRALAQKSVERTGSFHITRSTGMLVAVC